MGAGSRSESSRDTKAATSWLYDLGLIMGFCLFQERCAHDTLYAWPILPGHCETRVLHSESKSQLVWWPRKHIMSAKRRGKDIARFEMQPSKALVSAVG